MTDSDSMRYEELKNRMTDRVEWRRENRDFIDNERSKVLGPEAIRSHCVWGVDFFPPSCIDRLVEGLDRLGWTREEELKFRKTPREWVMAARNRPAGTAWHNFGLLIRETDSRRMSSWTRKGRLPSAFDHAAAHIHQILPSHTAVVVQFVLRPESASVLEGHLSKRYITRLEGTGKAMRLLSPIQQKEHAVLEGRRQWKRGVKRWFREQLGGVLSSKDDSPFLTFEFTTTKVRVPFDRVEDSEPDNCYDILGMAWNPFAYACKDVSGLRLCQDVVRNSLEDHVILAAREDDFATGVDFKTYGGRDTFGFANYLSDLHPWIVRHALSSAMSLYEKNLAAVRDATLSASPESLDEWGSVADRQLVLRQDAFPFAHDTRRLAEQPALFRTVEAEFHPISEEYQGDGPLLEVLRNNVQARSERLREELAAVGETALATLSLLNVRTISDFSQKSNRLQWVITILTIVLAILTAVLVWVELRQPVPDSARTRSLSEGTEHVWESRTRVEFLLDSADWPYVSGSNDEDTSSMSGMDSPLVEVV